MNRENVLGCFVVAVILTVCVGAAIVALVQMREGSRQLMCQTKVKDLVLACNLYEGKYRVLPPSCHVKEYTDDDGVTAYNKDGYSFLADAWPNMGRTEPYDKVDFNIPLDEANGIPDEILKISLPMLRCPCAPGNQLPEITNYKAVSGTTRLAYEVSSRTDVPAEGLDIYGTGTLYTESDGVMYPGSRTRLADITDGLESTFLVAETLEPIFSRWIVGQECGVYTMRDDAVFSPPNDELPFVHLPEYTLNIYGVESTIPPERQGTNLDRDYAKSPYPWGENGFRSARYTKEPPTGTRLGPGSNHVGVVMHGYVNGSADVVSQKIDVAAYFFLTTRTGDDPDQLIAYPPE